MWLLECGQREMDATDTQMTQFHQKFMSVGTGHPKHTSFLSLKSVYFQVTVAAYKTLSHVHASSARCHTRVSGVNDFITR